MKTGETNISVHADYYDQWDADEEWEECHSCWGTGLDDEEIYDCMVCGGEGEIRIYIPKISPEISVEQPLTNPSPR